MLPGHQGYVPTMSNLPIDRNELPHKYIINVTGHASYASFFPFYKTNNAINVKSSLPYMIILAETSSTCISNKQ